MNSLVIGLGDFGSRARSVGTQYPALTAVRRLIRGCMLDGQQLNYHFAVPIIPYKLGVYSCGEGLIR